MIYSIVIGLVNVIYQGDGDEHERVINIEDFHFVCSKTIQFM